MNSCDIKSSNNNDSSSTMSEKDFREYDKVRLKSNDPLDWRKEEEALPSDSHSPSIEELRRIEDPDKAEAYFRENMTSLLKEAWDKEQQKRK